LPSRTSPLNSFAAEFLRFFEWNARLELSEKKKRGLDKRNWRIKVKTYLDCIPCFVRQALEASRMATNDEVQQEKALKKVLSALGKTLLKSADIVISKGQGNYEALSEVDANIFFCSR
jgi:hypothetical protein